MDSILMVALEDNQRSPVSRILSHHPLETTNVCINVISIHPVHHIFSLD